MGREKFLRNFDWTLLATVILLGLFGLLMVAASTNTGDAELREILTSRFVFRQGVFLLIGIGAMVLLSIIDYNEWRRFIIPIYIFTLFVLLLVMFRGQSGILGAQRWIQIGFFSFQPSEFAKITIILTMAVVLSREDFSIDSWYNLALAIGPAVPPMILIFMQPDLGTSLVFIAITIGALFVAGIRWIHLGILSLSGLIGSVLAYLFVFKDYQQQRLAIFLDPWQDLQGMGWQIIQSKIAVGSGQFWGRGLFQGTQSQLDFLPEKHTDFIFSVVGEELGFLGAMALLAVYLFMVWKVFQVALEAKDLFGRLICIGVSSMLIFQLVVNVGMTISVMPVTGLPLPLISYGGSSLLATCIGMGLVLSVAAHRDTSLF